MTTIVRGYTLICEGGLWFLIDRDHRIVSTLVDMGAGVWRAVTLDGGATTITVPGDVDDPAVYVAEQITSEAAMQPTTWKKSQRCAGNGACVEVGVIDKQTRGIRDSAMPDGPWLLLTREQLRGLFDEIKARDVVHTP